MVRALILLLLIVPLADLARHVYARAMSPEAGERVEQLAQSVGEAALRTVPDVPQRLVRQAIGAHAAYAEAAERDAGGQADAAGEPSAEVLALRADLARLIRSPGWRNAQWSVMVVSLDRGDTLYAHEPGTALAPASNMKLFTSAAALYYLGPEFRYATYLLTDGTIEAGVLTGDLIVYGTGDPTLTDRFYRTRTAVWEMLADTLAARGVTRILGDVVGDATYFTGSPIGTGWQESYMNASYAAQAGALSANDNIVTLRILPGAEVGWRPRVQVLPGGDGIAIVNQATTRGGQTRIDVGRVAYSGPIVVRGQINPGHRGVWRAVPVADPARYAAAVFRDVLERRGIQVEGELRSVNEPESSPLTGRSVFAPAFDERPALRVLAVHRSPPLQQVLELINQRSHNLSAEQVLRTIGRVAVGDGSVEGGAYAVRYMIQQETRADSTDVTVDDGSGLSALNRASARSIIHLLAYMRESPMWESFWNTLPEAGRSEGLRRMGGTPAAGNLRAKTGTIDRVSALSGYVTAGNGEQLAFSIISNNVPSTWRAKRVEDAIGARLARFRRPTAAPVLALGEEGRAAGNVEATTSPPTSAAGSGATGSGTEAASSRAGAPRTYVIRRGDTLEAIARRHGTTVSALRAANPGVNPRRLMPGQSIRLPD